MKNLRLYGARLLVALLLTLVAYNASGSSRSEAGTTWTLRVPGFNNLRSVTYGNGLFVAVGEFHDGGTILTSPDGVNWTQRVPGTSNDLESVGYGNNTFVAVGWYGIIFTSPDGVNWMVQTSPTRAFLSGVTYGNGTFVAVAFYGTILTSP